MWVHGCHREFFGHQKNSGGGRGQPPYSIIGDSILNPGFCTLDSIGALFFSRLKHTFSPPPEFGSWPKRAVLARVQLPVLVCVSQESVGCQKKFWSRRGGPPIPFFGDFILSHGFCIFSPLNCHNAPPKFTLHHWPGPFFIGVKAPLFLSHPLESRKGDSPLLGSVILPSSMGSQSFDAT